MNKRLAMNKSTAWREKHSWDLFGKRLVGRCSNCSGNNTVLRRYDNNQTWCDCCLTHNVRVETFGRVSSSSDKKVSVRELKERLRAIGVSWESLHEKAEMVKGD